jgi:hypothetical protein
MLSLPLQKWQASGCCLWLPFDVSDVGDGSEIVDIMRAVKANAKAEVMFPAS